MAVKRNYRINLRNYGNSPAIMVSQYDENYDLVFEVYDGVVPATGLNAYTVKLVGRQPGDDPALKYEFTGTVSGIANNILSFTIDTTMTGRAGKGTAEIVILDTTNDVKFASFNLPVYVEKAAVPDDAIDADVERAQEIAEEVQEIVDTAAAEVKGEAEAWAVGERDGEPVPSTDPTYHNNAKYYAEQAQDIADSIGIDATLSISGKAADAKKTGDEISSLKEDLSESLDDVKTAVNYVSKGEISEDELYNGYKIRALNFQKGRITGGSYDPNADGLLSDVLSTVNNTKVINRSNNVCYIIYMSAYTDWSDFTYALYITVNIGSTVNLSAQYPYFAICTPVGVNDAIQTIGIEVIGESDVDYLSNASYVQLKNSLEDKLGKSELYSGVIYEAPTFEHGWINSSGVYNPSDRRFISQKFDTSEIDAVVNGSSKTIYVVYFSSFTDFSNFTYGTYVTITSGDSLALTRQYPYFAIESTATATTDLAGISVQKSSDIDYLAFDRIGLAGDEQLRNVEAARRTYTDTLTDNIASNPLPTFLHIADIHGDRVRFNNAVKMADAIDVDAILDTGDDVFFNSTDSVAFIEDSLSGKNLVYLPTIGNHDSYTLTEQGMYEKYIDSHKTGLVLDSNVSYSTYYYKDFAGKKLRLISVNQFQYRGKSNNATERNYHQAQIDFLCGALLNAPDDYGIIVMIHTPEANPTKSVGYTKFYQDDVPYFNSGASIAPIYEIVDAFISGVALNKTFSNVSGNNPATFTVNVDFSGKNDSEFICFVSGHRHADGVYYLPNMTNKILMINSVCSNSWSHLNTGGSQGSNYPYFTELSDLPRVIGTGTENSINVFTVDRVRKSIRIVRLGSDMPYNFAERRDYMVIPYADTE